ncbi:hypothetical protein MPH_09356 [Macrophomina phaseolina MS6]|uniref:Uncharacterized protein n=1 Tax=Macrophomina phaseolina (strain MS6) TaxID=1126212 RepID=K2RFX8_MACPH|nr:hypothetical protein MPH_09356 [Macrophomina phaseolina MS6]
MAQQPIHPQGFASGLENFGPINWDAEFDELTTKQSTQQTLSTPEIQEYSAPIGNLSTGIPIPIRAVSVDDDTPTNPTNEGDSSPNWTVISSDEDEDTPNPLSPPIDTATLPVPPTSEVPFCHEDFFTWQHPGWTATPSPSLHPTFTSTPPEICAWAYAPAIWDDADWILGCTAHGDYYAHNDIPRVASCLRRAYRELYLVPESTLLPWLAGGFKVYARKESQRPKAMFERGCKGSKEEGHFPGRSRMADVWNADEMEFVPDEDIKIEEERLVAESLAAEREDEARLSVEETKVERLLVDENMAAEEEKGSSEDEWSSFSSSEEGDDEAKELLADSNTTSVESLLLLPPDEELFVEATTPTVKLPNTSSEPEPTTEPATSSDGGSGGDYGRKNNGRSFGEDNYCHSDEKDKKNEEKDTIIPILDLITPLKLQDPFLTTSSLSEDTLSTNKSDDTDDNEALDAIIETFGLATTTVESTTPPGTPPAIIIRTTSPAEEQINHSSTTESPGPELIGYGRRRSQFTFIELINSPSSPALLSPQRTFRNSSHTRGTSTLSDNRSEKTLYQMSVEKYGRGEDDTKDAPNWKTTAAAAVAVIGGIFALIG